MIGEYMARQLKDKIPNELGRGVNYTFECFG